MPIYFDDNVLPFGYESVRKRRSEDFQAQGSVVGRRCREMKIGRERLIVYGKGRTDTGRPEMVKRERFGARGNEG